jgi:hypothetical protein
MSSRTGLTPLRGVIRMGNLSASPSAFHNSGFARRHKSVAARRRKEAHPLWPLHPNKYSA